MAAKLACALVSSLGCGGGAPLGAVGSSAPRGPEAPTPSAPSRAAVDEPRIPAAWRGSVAPVSDAFLSRGHAERFIATVWANAAGVDAGADVDSAGGRGEGAVLLEQLSDPGARPPAPAGWLAMEKRGGGWTFSIVERTGAALDAGSSTEACAACHAAARDGVFPWPAGDGSAFRPAEPR